MLETDPFERRQRLIQLTSQNSFFGQQYGGNKVEQQPTLIPVKLTFTLNLFLTTTYLRIKI
jgi:hypothetical protein